MPEDKQVKKDNEAELVEVPTATAIAFKLEDGNVVDMHEVLVKIYNDVQKLKKGLL